MKLVFELRAGGFWTFQDIGEFQAGWKVPSSSQSLPGTPIAQSEQFSGNPAKTRVFVNPFRPDCLQIGQTRTIRQHRQAKCKPCKLRGSLRVRLWFCLPAKSSTAINRIPPPGTNC